MLDRFRFRAWDKVRKQYEDCKVYLNTNGKLIGFYGRDERLDGFYIVEQCTGLKDKNGKLIYEGDIFEADVLNSFNGDELIGKRIRGQVAYYTDGTCFTFARYAPFELGQIEIIGNIHENMELLR